MNLLYLFYSYSILLYYSLLTRGCYGFWYGRRYHKKPASVILNDLSKYINKNEDPCDNFYKFSCGKWIDETKLSRDEKIISQFSHGENKFKKFLKEAVRGDYDDDSPAIKKINYIKTKCSKLNGFWRSRCFEKLSSGFGLYPYVSYFLHKEFIKNKDTRRNFKIIGQMFNNLKNEFKLLLNERDNMLDGMTKRNYMKKIDNMKIDTSVIITLSNLKTMEECYKLLEISRKDSYKIILFKIRFFLTRLYLSKKTELNTCFKIITNYSVLKFGILANAAYLVEHNEIIITPMLIDKPMFSPDYPMSYNYGSIGFILGHEIIHGFDNVGIHFDHEGDYDRSMTSYRAKMRYREKADCLENQYNEERNNMFDKNVDGRLTLRENIADNGAIKITHRAYMRYLKNIGGQEKGVGKYKNYTDEQLFFINFGKTFCEKVADGYVRSSHRFDEHSPGEVRVIKTLSNYRPFSKAFNCMIGDNMNPIDKCEVWMY
uniref:Phosphate-regulating neutral endopeptidase (inferred by orthology to a human protein) n=1 Tax=Strongyloides venezuelensis TaxID=75913 RepID=A0A0K0EUP4_STRVS